MLEPGLFALDTWHPAAWRREIVDAARGCL